MKHLNALHAFCAALMLFAACHSIGCGYGAVACNVVDAAAQACTVIRYMDSDGKMKEVRVSNAELRMFGSQMAARRAAEASK